MSWTPGVDMPPFEVHNLQAVEFALGLAEGTVAMSAVPVSKAVAVQLWQLFCGETARRPARCKQFTFAQVRLALSALALGTPAAGMPQPLLSRMALHNELLRPAKHGAKGLVLLLKEELRLRKSHPDMKDMGLEEARAHILKKWDTELLVAAGGGGGGDPAGGSAGSTSQEPPPQAELVLDIRTRTFQAATALLAASQRAQLQAARKPLTSWHEVDGALPADALRCVDALVRAVPLTRARKEETHELQAVQLRKEIDKMRGELHEAQAEARRHDLAGTRALRALDAAREEHRQQLREAAALVEERRLTYQAQLKDQRSAAAAVQRALKVEMQDERLAAEWQITELQAIITRQDRALNSARAALSSSSKQREAELGKLQAEMQKVSEGRIWSRVREEEERRRRAEVLVTELRAQVDEQGAALRERSQKVRASPFPARPLSPATDYNPRAAGFSREGRIGLVAQPGEAAAGEGRLVRLQVEPGLL